jgi:glycosyltransferase involved in cell wall biosynthesis
MTGDKAPRTPGTRPAGQSQLAPYVLVTAARDEIASIERTIKSVVAQTHRPMKWVIVSDGSTDGTDQLVQEYCRTCDWMELVRMPERSERNFAGKAEAFNAGYGRVKDIPYHIMGNLDADLSFDEDFFSFLVAKFAENPRLGVAGAPFQEGESTYDYRFTSIEHVSGACQLFRRECFEEIGGYEPIKSGGIDLIAVVTARMRGWQTRTFTEKRYLHHRKMGTAKDPLLKARFKVGQKDYLLGSHPVWVVFRSLYQMSGKPIVIGGAALFLGYFTSMIERKKRPVRADFVSFRRQEQMQRLGSFFRTLFSRGRSPRPSG